MAVCVFPAMGLAGAVLLSNAAAAQSSGAGKPFEIPPECQVAIPPVIGTRTLTAVHEALTKGKLRILAIGSSSTVGVGASFAAATYPARLQERLRGIFGSKQITVINRGISGETALGAAARMQREVTNAKPDVVIWQLGTNAALHDVQLSRLIATVQRTVRWVRSQGIAMIFIDPQFVNIHKDNAHYGRTVDALTGLAEQESIVLVRRYASMRDIARRRRLDLYLAKDRFHLNDLGYRCMAAYATHAIVKASEARTKITLD
ncbi:MAG TPA: SGNH/GDSL hydrolase family protein [Hyphomicrobiaceae bacterium]|nr:SGNH/GDSL hydrolase family protein [Hyphomicrobiaceae bacterium]